MPPAELVTRQPTNFTRSTGLYQLPTSKKWFNRSFDRCKSTSPFEKIEASLFRVLSNMLPTLARPLTMPSWDNSHKRIQKKRPKVTSFKSLWSFKSKETNGLRNFCIHDTTQVAGPEATGSSADGTTSDFKKKLARSSTEKKRRPQDPKEAIRICFSSYIYSIREPKYPWHPPPWFLGHLSRSLCPLPRRR